MKIQDDSALNRGQCIPIRYRGERQLPEFCWLGNRGGEAHQKESRSSPFAKYANGAWRRQGMPVCALRKSANGARSIAAWRARFRLWALLRELKWRATKGWKRC
jgi:hypothetical protein